MDILKLVAIRDSQDLPTGYHKAILYALVSRGENAYPNQSQLMRDAGIGSRNTLIKTIKELESLGWLKISKDKWRSNQYKNNRYEVHVPNLIQGIVKSDDELVKSDTLKINKDKVKVNIIEKKRNSREGWNHSTISDWIETA